MLNRSMLLSQAKQYRTCPPPLVRRDSTDAEKMAHHLKICPYCSLAETAEEAAAEELMDGFMRILRPSEPSELKDAGDVIEPGQLRYIRSELACWRSGYFYNPPLILVLENTRAISDDILAAQVCHETGLAGPGDLILSHDQTGAGKLFVEPWNLYTLKRRDLGPVKARISGEIVQNVRELENNPEKLPDWAPITMPFKENDPRLYFREMEIEVGYVFSSRAVAELVEELEKTEGAIPDLDALMTELKRLAPNGDWMTTPRSPEEALVGFQEFKLAADDGDAAQRANWFCLSNGRIRAVETAPIKDQRGQMTKDGYSVTGQIAFEGCGPISNIYCRLETVNGELLQPKGFRWKADTGVFKAAFDASAEGVLKMAVIELETDDEGSP